MKSYAQESVRAFIMSGINSWSKKKEKEFLEAPTNSKNVSFDRNFNS